MAYSTKAWYDKCYISVAPNTGSEVQLRAKTTSLSITGGGFDIEGLDTFGGKVTRVGTKDDIEISFDGIPVSAQDYDWIYHGYASTTNSITSSTTKKHRVTILWTDQSGVTAATQAISSSSEAYRRIYAEAYCTGIEVNMDAGAELTATMTFSLPVEDETGGQNYKIESCDTSSALSAVPPYTQGTNKF